jgi:hypothetical protein
MGKCATADNDDAHDIMSANLCYHFIVDCAIDSNNSTDNENNQF